MNKRILITIIFLSVTSFAYGDYFKGLSCNQDKPLLKNPHFETCNQSFSFCWYKSNDEKETIGAIESEYVSYMFWNDKFFGKVYEITGKDNINEVLRFFKQEVERIYDEDPENDFFKHPIERKDGSWVFVEPDKIIIIRRYSLNLGRVEILCRDLWAKRNGITGLLIDDLKK